jgi:hypothetical protein
VAKTAPLPPRGLGATRGDHEDEVVGGKVSNQKVEACVAVAWRQPRHSLPRGLLVGEEPTSRGAIRSRQRNTLRKKIKDIVSVNGLKTFLRLPKGVVLGFLALSQSKLLKLHRYPVRVFRKTSLSFALLSSNSSSLEPRRERTF